MNNSVSCKENIVQGEKYRFTILSPRLIRLEYNNLGIFEDRPTENVLYRNMAPVKYELNENERSLEIKTNYFQLRYQKNKPFFGGKINSTRYLQVNLLNSDRIWYYGHPEVRNYGTPSYSLDNNDGKLKFKKGLYSVDGFVTLDDSKSSIINENGILETRSEGSIDIYLFMYLRDFGQCLKDYYSLTGYPAFLPRYAFGNWWSKDKKYNDLELKDLINTFIEKEIPLSVLLLDKDWHIRNIDNNDYNSGYTWNNDLFSNPKEFIEYIHQNNIKLGLNINTDEPIMPYENNFDAIATNLGLNGIKQIPFTVWDSNFINNYFKELINPLDNIGVDFYWLDNENKDKTKELWYMVNLHYQKMNSNNKRGIVLSRNHMINSHKYPILYSGKTIVSWDTLKNLPFYNSSATNMGISYWTHDIGGFYKGTEDNELYTRFVQFGVFSPILKFGSAGGKYYKREPWKWSMKTYSIVKDYLNLRHQLIPYIYAEAYKYHTYGIPMIMPIYYKVPKLYDDINFRNGYFFGQEFYIAPIINKKDFLINRSIHRFYLPDGIWYDFKNGKKFIGNKNYVSFFKEEDYPVFVKQGGIIPLARNESINDTSIPKNLEIQIFPGKNNNYMLYEDDGITNNYKNGSYFKTNIEYNYLKNNYTVIVRAIEGKPEVVPDRRNYKFIFRNTKKADNVIAYFNNTKINVKAYVLGPNFIVEAYNIPTMGQLTINCQGKDIEIDNLRIINEDIESIISDLQISTELKENIDSILFNNDSIKKKRIKIRKLVNKGLDKKFVELFLKLLEYVEQI